MGELQLSDDRMAANRPTLAAKWITCNVCGADAFKPLATVDEWQIGRCSRCSLIYVNPMPFFQPSLEFSQLSLEFQYTRFQHQITADVIAHDRNQMQLQFARLTQIAGPGAGRPRRLLDVGCGSGTSVRAAVDLGWEAIGIDLDPVLVELGRRKLQVDLRCGSLVECDLDENHYDFIRLRDVIEHLPNPYEALLKIRQLLRPGGVVLIATPNEEAASTQLRLLLGGKRNRVASVPPPHHLHGFGPKTLRLLFKRTGLKPIEIGTTTPVDPAYVTARNMQSSGKGAHVAFWHAAKAIGMGSMLIGWAQRSGSDSRQSASSSGMSSFRSSGEPVS
jgi:2-polyprenyl-3-methyl-5-hydroxy-6-metoxy-1,4-benzoquinol methylase